MKIIRELISELHWLRVSSVLIQLIAFCIFAGMIAAVFTGWITWIPYLLAGCIFGTGIIFATYSGKFSTPKPEEITRFLDRNYPFMEESASLMLIQPAPKTMKFLQQEKVLKRLESESARIKLPKDRLKRAISFAGLWLLLSCVIIAVNPSLKTWLNYSKADNALVLKESGLSEGTKKPSIPAIDKVVVMVNPPAYTQQKEQQSILKNLSVPEQSIIKWQVHAMEPINEAAIIFSDGGKKLLQLDTKSGSYNTSIKATENKIYQLALSNSDTTIYSIFYSIGVIRDQPPGFVVEKPFEKRDFITLQKRNFEIAAQVGDDYKVTSVKIQATLARGSGENVRFRERVLDFNKVAGLNSQKVNVEANLNADYLEMEPGDELYFYITATDNKPETQTARSDTYFIIYADSGEAPEIQMAGFGVDLLPEYFRSQRQIIIDTEALLEEKQTLTKAEFNDRSDIIGYNQNLLRKRYGNYLGQEDAMSSAGVSEAATDEGHAQQQNQNGEESADDHAEGEGVNGMGLQNEESTAASVIPDEFFHDHGAAEMNNLYAESPRALLKKALDNMWNSERYLRTYQPKEALPYEYAALEFLKAVQQANRKYTRKAGYELPPIPEDEKRLTGTYDDFANPDGEKETARIASPLVQLQLVFNEKLLEGKALTEKAKELVQQANITDADRLYLLNRIRIIENEADKKTAVQEIIHYIAKLNNRLQLDPAPNTLPSISQSSPNK